MAKTTPTTTRRTEPQMTAYADEDDRETYAQNELDHDRVPTAEGYAEWQARRADEADAPTADECAECGAHIADPHTPGCTSDSDPVTPV